jgi:flagellar FliL protein
MPEKSEAPAAPPPETKAGIGSKIPLILGAVNTVLLAGVLAVTLRGPAAAAKPASADAAHAEGGEAAAEAHGSNAPAEGGGDHKEGAPKAGGPGPTVRLPDFIVHLRDPDADRYARISFEVELSEEKAKDALNARLPQVRDSFLAYLSDRSVEELRGSEAMSLLKEALTKRLREIAPGAPVKALYVTDLVVQ